MNPFQALSFDCYGTLIDWKTGFYQSATRILEGRVPALALDELWKSWKEIQSRKCDEPYRPYRAIVGESFIKALTTMGISVHSDDGENLALRFPGWKPFEDVTPTLKKLKGRLPLLLISNTDDEILNANVLSMGLSFDGSMTGTRAKAYKPRPEMFQRAIEVLGMDPAKTLHVARSARTDLMTAKGLGFKTAWLKRGQERPDAFFEPDFVFESMGDLLKIVFK